MATKTNSLKIGLVVDDTLDKTDGVQQYVLGIGAWLAQQGHDVHYLAGETARKDLTNVHSLSKNIQVRFNGNHLSVPLPTSQRKIRQFLNDQQFDVLHVQMPYSPFLAQRIITAASPKTAVIGTFHILPNSKFVTFASRFLAVWLRKSLKRFDQIFSVSPAAQAFSKQIFKIDSDVLPNVFDYQLFHTAKSLPEYDDTIPTILFLGRLVSRKGCGLLLEAVLALKQEHPDLSFRVIICGKGALLESLQKFSEDHALTNIVEFAGFVNEADKPKYYASSKVTVFPSSGGESFGIVLLEAMASGRAAVLAGDNPGYRSVMSQRPELLFDPTDPLALAAKLYEYLTNNELRKNAQNWGQDYVKAFDTPVVGQKLLKAYDKALRNRAEQ